VPCRHSGRVGMSFECQPVHEEQWPLYYSVRDAASQ
jgi:hypothetical protein